MGSAKSTSNRLLLLLLLIALSAPASATEDVPAGFAERIDVRLVSVEVVVEDKDSGKRVTGLAADQFVLRIDGEPVELTHFAEIRNGKPVPAAGAPASPPPPALAGGGAVGNSYLVYIDDYFSIGIHRDLALDQLRRQLDRIAPPDRMAIVAFGGRDLELLAPWTSDRAELRQAVDRAKTRPAYGLVRFGERLRQGIAVPPSAAGDFFPGEQEYELERTAAALEATLHGFAAAPGRKVALILSGGWPSIDLGNTTRRTFSNSYETDLEILRPVVETANLLGFTLYPLDLPGIRPSGTTRIAGPSGFDTSWRLAAGNRQSRDSNIAAAPDSTFIYGQPFDTFFAPRRSFFPQPNEHKEILRQSTLRVLGRDTGGRALLGSERKRPLTEIMDDTGSYYWLSFTPRREYDDRVHRIKVDVPDGLSVRSRRSFRDLSAPAKARMATLGAALVAQEQRVNDFEVAVGTPRRLGRREIELPLTLRVPADRVVFVPAAGGFVAQLELRLAAVAAADRHSEVPLIPVTLSRESQPAPGTVLPFATRVTVSKRAHTLAVTLYDPFGGQALVATVEIPR